MLNHFSSVFTLEPDGDAPLPPDQHVSSPLDSMVITEELILKKLIQLDVSKSPGPDNLHSVVLKTVASSLVKPLSIYNTSLRTGILPSDWLKAHVSAVFKKGDRALPNNYRPISLTCILCKVLESLLRDAIINHLSNNKLFSTKQFGFIPGRSTSLQVAYYVRYNY